MGTDLSIGSSTLKDVPENLATVVSMEYSNLLQENKRLDSENQRLKEERTDMGSTSYEIDGKTYKDMGSMYKDMKKMHSEYTDIKKKYEDMKGKHDVLDTQLRERSDSLSSENIIKMRRADRALEKIARNHLPDYTEERFDSMSSIEVKKAIINGSGLNASDYSESAYDGMIALIAKNDSKRDENYQKQKQMFASDGKNDRFDADEYLRSLDAEQEFAIANAWKEDFVTQGGLR